MEILSRIEEKTKELDIPLFGISDVHPVPFLNEYKKILSEKDFGDLNYLYKLKEREKPEMLLNGLKSIIAFLFPYNFKSNKSLSLEKFKIAEYAKGRDYHQKICKKLKEISKILPGKSKIICDTSPFLEKPYGAKAGLGFIGKNTLLINDKFGSAFNLGFILTDLKLPEKKINSNKNCGSCERCIEVCPTGALEKPFHLNPLKCISYLTLEKKVITDKTSVRWGYIYGCDLCQAVCPYNLKLKSEEEEEVSEFERISQERLELNKEIVRNEKIDFYIKQEEKYFPLNPKLKFELLKIMKKRKGIFYYKDKKFSALSEKENYNLWNFFSKLQIINKKKEFEFILKG